MNLRPTTRSLLRRACAALAGALSLTLAISAAHAEDVVHLRNGGRIRGTVIEESPTAGVRIKLADGRIRALKPEEVFRVEYDAGGAAPPPGPEAPAQPTAPGAPPPPVAPPPPPPEIKRGDVVIRSNAPGRVLIDGAERGSPPLTVTLPEGSHKIRIDFDGGGSDAKTVLVAPGPAAEVDFSMSETRKLFGAHKRGVRVGISLEPTFAFVFHQQLAYGGGRGTLYVNVGLAPAIDLRAGAFGTAEQGEFGGFSPVGGVILARVNLGSFYTLSAGFQAGALIATELERVSYGEPSSGEVPRFHDDVLRPGAFLGPRWSVLGLRLGSKKQLELDVYQSVAIHADDSEMSWYENGLSLTYLFLPEAAPSPSARAAAEVTR